MVKRTVRGYKLVTGRELEALLDQVPRMLVPVMLNYRWAFAAGLRDILNMVYKVRVTRKDSAGYALFVSEFGGAHTFKLDKEGRWIFFRDENKLDVHNCRVTREEPVFMLPVFLEDGIVRNCMYCGRENEFFLGADSCPKHGATPLKEVLTQYKKVAPAWLCETVVGDTIKSVGDSSRFDFAYREGDWCPMCDVGRLESHAFTLKCEECWYTPYS